MSGLVKKKNFYLVFKAFGLVAAIKYYFSRDKTFLEFCVKNGLI